MQDQRRNVATVVMLKSHGEERIRQAIAQGMVREDLMDDFKEVLSQVDSMRSELQFVQSNLTDAQKSLTHFQKTYYDALKAKQREDARNEKFSNIKLFAMLFGSTFVIIFLCMMICRWIFG